MARAFERSIQAQGIEPEQYYQFSGTNHHDMEERVKPDAEDTVKKEFVLDAVASAEGIVADEEAVMHEIGHLAEESGRSPEEEESESEDEGEGNEEEAVVEVGAEARTKEGLRNLTLDLTVDLAHHIRLT